MVYIQNIMRSFPLSISRKIEEFFISENVNLNYLEEIRFRTNCPILIKIGDIENKIEHITTRRRNFGNSSDVFVKNRFIHIRAKFVMDT